MLDCFLFLVLCTVHLTESDTMITAQAIGVKNQSDPISLDSLESDLPTKPSDLSIDSSRLPSVDSRLAQRSSEHPREKLLATYAKTYGYPQASLDMLIRFSDENGISYDDYLAVILGSQEHFSDVAKPTLEDLIEYAPNEILLQLICYAAILKLKSLPPYSGATLERFPEGLRRYYPQERKGFVEETLERLRKWEIKPLPGLLPENDLSDTGLAQAAYHTSLNVFMTRASNPLPDLEDFYSLRTLYHELFHSYQDGLYLVESNHYIEAHAELVGTLCAMRVRSWGDRDITAYMQHFRSSTRKEFEAVNRQHRSYSSEELETHIAGACKQEEDALHWAYGVWQGEDKEKLQVFRNDWEVRAFIPYNSNVIWNRLSDERAKILTELDRSTTLQDQLRYLMAGLEKSRADIEAFYRKVGYADEKNPKEKMFRDIQETASALAKDDGTFERHYRDPVKREKIDRAMEYIDLRVKHVAFLKLNSETLANLGGDPHQDRVDAAFDVLNKLADLPLSFIKPAYLDG